MSNIPAAPSEPGNSTTYCHVSRPSSVVWIDCTAVDAEVSSGNTVSRNGVQLPSAAATARDMASGAVSTRRGDPMVPSSSKLSRTPGAPSTVALSIVVGGRAVIVVGVLVVGGDVVVEVATEEGVGTVTRGDRSSLEASDRIPISTTTGTDVIATTEVTRRRRATDDTRARSASPAARRTASPARRPSASNCSVRWASSSEGPDRAPCSSGVLTATPR